MYPSRSPTSSGPAGFVPVTRRIDPGYGLVGGGDLSADRVIAVDSAVIAALAGATFTGPVRGPAPVVGADLTTKTYVDAQIAAVIAGDPIYVGSTYIDVTGLTISAKIGLVGDIQAIGTAAAAGTSGRVADAAHVHGHGAQTDGTLHAAATTLTNGFMTTADRTFVNTFNLAGAAVGMSLTHNGTAFVPHTLTASDVGAVPTSRQVGTALGTGLQGGGALSGDLALSVIFATTAQPLGAAAGGSANTVSHGDHVHAMPTAADVGAVPATGGGTTTGTLSAVPTDATSGGPTTALILTHAVSPGPTTNGVGVAASFRNPNAANVIKEAGFVQGTLTNVTAGAEDGQLDFGTGSGGAAPTTKWSLTHGGTWDPAADNTYDVGSLTHRVGNVFSAKVVTSTVGPNGSQQHTVPATASDTLVLESYAQTLTNKTLNGLKITFGSDVIGDIPINTGGAGGTYSKLAAGTNGYLLTSNGPGVAPSWQAAPATGVPTSRTLTAGAGLTGGGDLTADRTFDVGAGTGITVNANDVAVDQSFSPTWTGTHVFNGNVTLGNATSDTVTVTSQFVGSLVSTITNTDDLGTTLLKWRTGYFATSVLTPTLGVDATHQHTVPNVANDTIALLGATQTLTATTLSAPKWLIGSDAIGDIPYTSNAGTGAIGRIAAGTSGYVLTSNGAGIAPSWQALPAAGVTSLAATSPIAVSGATGAVTVSISDAAYTVTGAVNATTQTFSGLKTIRVHDASTTSVTDVLYVAHTTSSAGGNGLGVGVALQGYDSASALYDIARVEARATTNTAGATYTTLAFQTRYNNSLFDALTINNSSGVSNVSTAGSILSGALVSVPNNSGFYSYAVGGSPILFMLGINTSNLLILGNTSISNKITTLATTTMDVNGSTVGTFSSTAMTLASGILLQNTDASGTNIAGNNLALYAGKGTGTGAVSYVSLKGSIGTTTGASAHTLGETFRAYGQYASFPAGIVHTPTSNAKTGSYTILITDNSLGWLTAGGVGTPTLPAANAVPAGWEITIYDFDGSAATNNITITRAGADTIEGANTKVINTAYGSVTLRSDGSSKWKLVGSANLSSAGSAVLADGSVPLTAFWGVGAYGMDFTKVSGTPSTPAANHARLYFKMNGSSKMQLVAMGPDGVEGIIWTQA